MAIEQRTHERAYELHVLLLANASTQEEKDQVPTVAICKVRYLRYGTSDDQPKQSYRRVVDELAGQMVAKTSFEVGRT